MLLQRCFWALLLLSLPIVSAYATEEWETHDRIIQSATDYLEQRPPVDAHQTRIEIKPGHLDPRLRLKACEKPLQSSDVGKEKLMGRVLVEVRCEGSKPWKVRIPVMISVYAPVAITSRPVARQQVLTKSDIIMKDHDISGLNRGYYSNIENVVGLVTRNQIRSGIVINPALIRPPYLVKRGQKVKIFAKTTNYQVAMYGEALSDGARGEVIKVRNSTSRKVVEGVVIAPGIIQVSHR